MTETNLSKYNVAVPRYTSYPPANYFREGFSENEYVTMLDESNQWQPSNISFYVHIPFCRKMCFYCGCNSCPIPKGNQVQEYVDALIKEIQTVKKHLDPQRKIAQIHFGGGTPNAIPVSEIVRIIQQLSEGLTFIEQPELAIECNPAYLDQNYIDALKDAGINRFSLGVQDFHENVLKNVNREIPTAPVQETVAMIKNGSPHIAVNLDFIYGLPGQTLSGFMENMQQVLEIRPDRMVTFSYAHVPWFNKRQQKLEKIGLPEPEEKQLMFDKASAFLLENGYGSIGFDHFVLPSDELFTALQSNDLKRNFQGYCTKRTTGQVYAFGVSGINQFQFGYIQNIKSVKQYIATINNGIFPVFKGYRLNRNEMIVRSVIEQVMCNGHIRWEDTAGRLNVSVEALKKTIRYDENALQEMQNDGLLVFNNDGFEVLALGMNYIRNIAASLDPLMTGEGKKFSKIA